MNVGQRSAAHFAGSIHAMKPPTYTHVASLWLGDIPRYAGQVAGPTNGNRPRHGSVMQPARVRANGICPPWLRKAPTSGGRVLPCKASHEGRACPAQPSAAHSVPLDGPCMRGCKKAEGRRRTAGACSMHMSHDPWGMYDIGRYTGYDPASQDALAVMAAPFPPLSSSRPIGYIDGRLQIHANK